MIIASFSYVLNETKLFCKVFSFRIDKKSYEQSMLNVDEFIEELRLTIEKTFKIENVFQVKLLYYIDNEDLDMESIGNRTALELEFE